jgi:hypothetical protein
MRNLIFVGEVAADLKTYSLHIWKLVGPPKTPVE